MATADARAIVEHLAQPPWSRDLSILELSQLPPPQLLQLLVAALSKVHPKGEDQVRPASPGPARARGELGGLTRGRARQAPADGVEAMAKYVVDFLRYCKYKFPGHP